MTTSGNIKRIFSVLIIFFQFFNLNAQCFTSNTVFQAGENLNYIVYYNLGFIWVDAAEVTFKADSGTYQNRRVYYLKSTGKSFSRFDWLLKVRDTYTATLDSTTLKPLKYTQKTHEGGYTTNNKYFFNHRLKKLYTITENSKKPKSIDTLDILPCSFDLLSTVYYSRSINYSKYNINDKIPLTIYIDNKTYLIYIRYLGKETIETKDNKKYRCIKFMPLLVQTSMFDEGENMTVWLSNDKNRIPIMVESEIMIGSVKVILTDFTGLRHPFDCLEN